MIAVFAVRRNDVELPSQKEDLVNDEFSFGITAKTELFRRAEIIDACEPSKDATDGDGDDVVPPEIRVNATMPRNDLDNMFVHVWGFLCEN